MIFRVCYSSHSGTRRICRKVKAVTKVAAARKILDRDPNTYVDVGGAVFYFNGRKIVRSSVKSI